VRQGLVDERATDVARDAKGRDKDGASDGASG
jgi:hypothetical protein